MPAAMPLEPGAKLGPYEIVAPIDSDNRGEAYKASDTRLNRAVLVRILPSKFSENPETKQMLTRETQAIASLNHPNICAVYDVGHQDGADYFVMEYLEGETLAQRLT